MFSFKIVTPKGEYANMEAKAVSVPSIDGIITVLANHMDVIIPLDIGILKIENADKDHRYAISSGMFTFKENRGVLFVDTIEHEDEIDYVRAEAAKARALARIAKRESVKELERGELALKRSLVRLSLKHD